MIQAKPLTIEQEIEKLRTMYTKDIAQDTFNALVLGQQGTGKTVLLETCRGKVLLDSFDPGGTKSIRKAVANGRVIADTRFEHEDMNNPTAYKLWEDEFFRRRKMGMFDKLGTYVIDSFSTWFISLTNQIAKRRSGTPELAKKYAGLHRETGLMALEDWQVAGNVMRDVVKLCTALPCDFILTGHLLLEKEEVSGRMLAFFNSIPSLRVNIPILFDEIYIMEVDETSNGVVRTLLTQPTGKYVAKTRIGRDTFDTREKPDIKYLLKKAGLDHEDKK